MARAKSFTLHGDLSRTSGSFKISAVPFFVSKHISRTYGAETNIPPGKKILVVDDDQIILKTLTIALSCKGYQVLTAIDGPGAVSIVSRDRPDLILLDINFPPDAANVGGALQDGFFIVEWLRHMGQAEDIPIILISGDKSAKYRKRIQAAKVVGFFPKPIDHIALVDTIRNALGEDVADKPPGTPGTAEGQRPV